MSDEVGLPAPLAPDASIEQLRDAFTQLLEWARAREPLADGGVLEKFLTGSTAVRLGIGSLVPGATGVNGPGVSGDILVPGFGTYNPADTTPPDEIAGLTVTPGPTFFFVEFEAPVYLQGGANGRTVIYSATYSGTGPLPTFENAVEVFQCFGSATIAVIDAEPGSIQHFWAKAETRAGILQPDPTGGTNGVSATCGLIDGAEHVEALSIGTAQIADLAVTDAKIVTLSVDKLIAGSIAVGEHIQSTGFVSGSVGWQIKGDGTAEFSGVIVRGAFYATSGEIGNLTINGALTMNTSGHIKGGQTAYDTGTGFFLGYSGAAYKFSVGNSAGNKLTWDGSALTVAGNLSAGSSPAVSGTTMTGSGAVFNATGTFAIGNATRNLSFNGTDFTLNGTLVATGNIVSQAVTANYLSTIAEVDATSAGDDQLTVSIDSGLVTVSEGLLETFAILNLRVRLDTTNARWMLVEVTPYLYDEDDTLIDTGRTIKTHFYQIPTANVDTFFSVTIPQVFASLSLPETYYVRFSAVVSCYAGDNTLQINITEIALSGIAQLINRKV